jgi:hypothetical protein
MSNWNRVYDFKQNQMVTLLQIVARSWSQLFNAEYAAIHTSIDMKRFIWKVMIIQFPNFFYQTRNKNSKKKNLVIMFHSHGALMMYLFLRHNYDMIGTYENKNKVFVDLILERWEISNFVSIEEEIAILFVFMYHSTVINFFNFHFKMSRSLQYCSSTWRQWCNDFTGKLYWYYIPGWEISTTNSISIFHKEIIQKTTSHQENQKNI